MRENVQDENNINRQGKVVLGAQGLYGVLALRVRAGGFSLVGLKNLGVSTSNKFPQTFSPIVNTDFHLCGV